MTGPAPAVAAVRGAVRASLTDLEAASLVLVACSGGPDSLALAAATAFEAPRAGLNAGLLTVDHQLQPGSAEVAAQVAAWARTAGLDPVEVLTVRVDHAGGPEAAARAARYAALDRAAEHHGAAAVLLGHTRDDQAETVLLGLARGSGARSLAGMPAVRGRYRRPLLDLPRATTAAACAAEHLTPWVDPHNTDPAFARSRVRALLPALEQAAGPGVIAGLARSARLLRSDADALDVLAEELVDGARVAAGEAPSDLRSDLTGTVDTLDIATLAAAPAALRTRAIRIAARQAGARALTLAHLAAVDALVTAWRGQGPVHLPGLVVTRASGKLLLAGSDRSQEQGSE
ncbi:MAG: tRNA lysidine(34) synthetase TilS [Mycobacteriales bacterium]